MKLMAYKAALLFLPPGKAEPQSIGICCFFPGGDRKNKDIVDFVDSGFRKIRNLLFVQGKGASEGVYACS